MKKRGEFWYKSFFIFLFFSYISVIAQDKSLESLPDKALLNLAEKNYEKGNFLEALPFYEAYHQRKKDDLKVYYKLAICYLYKTDQPEKSLEILTELRNNNKFKTPQDFNFYLARANHAAQNFEKAAELYSLALKGFEPGSPEALKISLLMQQCQKGVELKERLSQLNKNEVTIMTLLPENINTPYNEYMPVISADENLLIFTYRGPKSTGGKLNDAGEPDPEGIFYGEDIFQSVKTGENWSPATPIQELNTVQNDAAISLSADGQTSLFYRNTADSSGNIYISKLDGEKWASPKSLPGFVNTEFWEGSACLAYNEKVLFFSSERPGGFGGRDIYKSVLLPNGQWSKPVNLGPTINTPYDEDAPFFFYDGTTLYFSSNGPNSVGGYDIFYAQLKDDSTWTTPVNVGLSINTPFDDKFYVINAQGNHGYFSSMRKGGKGLQDIYLVTPGHFASSAAFVLKGKVFVNDIPGYSDITVSISGTASDPSLHHSNSSSGKYLVVFPLGFNYLVKYEAEGCVPFEALIPIQNLTSFKDSVLDVYLYPQEILDKYINIDGYVKDPVTGEPLAGVKVVLRSKDGSVEREVYTDQNGYFQFKKVPKDKEYDILVDYPSMVDVIGNTKDLYGKPVGGIVINGQKSDNNGKFQITSGNYLADSPYAKGFPSKYKTFPEDAFVPYNDKNLRKNALKWTPDLLDKMLEYFGDAQMAGLEFRIQVGAYRRPKNFNKSIYESLDQVREKELDDKITRFELQTPVKTFREALVKRDMAKKLPYHDAFVTIYINGERMLFSKEILKYLK